MGAERDRCTVPAGLAPARRTEILNAFGVLNAAIIGEPGVLQARQRVTLRVRSVR